MEEENQQQVQQEPKEQQQVITKDPMKVEAGKRLAAINREAKKREEQVQLEKAIRWGFASRVNQYYGIGAVLAVGVIGGLGYYIYRTKKGLTTAERGASTIREVTMPVSQQPKIDKNRQKETKIDKKRQKQTRRVQ